VNKTKKNFVHSDLVTHICVGMIRKLNIQQWWWHTNSSGVL
jgi:hypothetical protein